MGCGFESHGAHYLVVVQTANQTGLSSWCNSSLPVDGKLLHVVSEVDGEGLARSPVADGANTSGADRSRGATR